MNTPSHDPDFADLDAMLATAVVAKTEADEIAAHRKALALTLKVGTKEWQEANRIVKGWESKHDFVATEVRATYRVVRCGCCGEEVSYLAHCMLVKQHKQHPTTIRMEGLLNFQLAPSALKKTIEVLPAIDEFCIRCIQLEGFK